MPKLITTQNYISRIQADLYWIERAMNKSLSDVEFARVINRLANVSYLAAQTISDLTEEISGEDRE